MSENVVKFPGGPKDPLVGPFTYNAVVVEGRLLPHLTGLREPNGSIALVVDERFSISVPAGLAYQVAWLVGQAMAVASGYSHIGAESKEQPFAPRVSSLGSPDHE